MAEGAGRLHPLHRLWRMLPAGPRRWAFVQATTAMAPRIARVAPPARAGIGVVGEMSRASGLGEGARLMAAGLGALGVPHWTIDVGDRLPGGGVPRPKVMPPAGAPLVFHINPPTLGWAMRMLPNGALAGRRIIGYWAWELPVPPPLWRAGLGLVHEVWVPSRFTADALRPMLLADGRIALRVVPHPVAIAPPRPAAMDRAAFGLPERAVVVLCSFNLASSMARKNPLAAIKAFRMAFGARDDRLLVLKIGHGHHFPDDLTAIRTAIGGAGNIRVETREMPRDALHALTMCADIVLSLHRSEGFGLVPAEAMLLGRPVVATGWSGNMDFMDDTCAALVDYRLVPAVDPRGVVQAPGAVWAEPDVASAAGWLVRLADDPGLRATMGARGCAVATARLGVAPLRAAVAQLGLAVPV